MVNRLVTMSGFETTVLDARSEVIQLMRRFRFLLAIFAIRPAPKSWTAAGLDKAQVLVAALDDPEGEPAPCPHASRKSAPISR